MSDISGVDYEAETWLEVTNRWQPYDEEDWVARLAGLWVPPAGEVRADFEIFKAKPRPPINASADRAARKRSGALCEACGRKFYQFQLEAHHLHYRTVGKESPWDLLIVCRECHRKQHADGDAWWNDTEQRAAWEWAFGELVTRPETIGQERLIGPLPGEGGG